MKYLLKSWLFLVLCSGYLVHGPRSQQWDTQCNRVDSLLHNKAQRHGSITVGIVYESIPEANSAWLERLKIPYSLYNCAWEKDKKASQSLCKYVMQKLCIEPTQGYQVYCLGEKVLQVQRSNEPLHSSEQQMKLCLRNCFNSYDPVSKKKYNVFYFNYDGIVFQIATTVDGETQDSHKTNLKDHTNYGGYNGFGQSGEVRPVNPKQRTILEGNKLFVHFGLLDLDVFSLIEIKNDQTFLELAKYIFQSIYKVCYAAQTMSNWESILNSCFPDSTYTKCAPDSANDLGNPLLTYLVNQGHIIFMRHNNWQVPRFGNLPYVRAQGFSMNNFGRVSIDVKGEIYTFEPQNCIKQSTKEAFLSKIMDLLSQIEYTNEEEEIDFPDIPSLDKLRKLHLIDTIENILSNMFGTRFKLKSIRNTDYSEIKYINEFTIKIHNKKIEIIGPESSLEFMVAPTHLCQYNPGDLIEQLAQNPDAVAELMNQSLTKNWKAILDTYNGFKKYYSFSCFSLTRTYTSR